MLNPGDLVFVRGHKSSLVDDAIKLGEVVLNKTSFPSNYCHVAVYIGGNAVMEAQGGRKSGTGDIGAYTDDYDIGHISMTYEQRRAFLKVLREENNLPYDWPGIFWLAVKVFTGYDRKYEEHRRRYCSKYVEWALHKVGIDVNGETPESLARDPKVRIEKG